MGNNTLLAGTAPEGTSNLHWHHGAGVLMLGIGWLVIVCGTLLSTGLIRTLRPARAASEQA